MSEETVLKRRVVSKRKNNSTPIKPLKKGKHVDQDNFQLTQSKNNFEAMLHGKQDNVWMENSFESNYMKQKTKNGTTPSKLASSKNVPIKKLPTPIKHTPGKSLSTFFEDSFNETDPFLADIDIDAIEQQHSQSNNTKQSDDTTSNLKNNSSKSFNPHNKNAVIYEQPNIRDISYSQIGGLASTNVKNNIVDDPSCGFDSDDGILSNIDLKKISEQSKTLKFVKTNSFNEVNEVNDLHVSSVIKSDDLSNNRLKDRISSDLPKTPASTTLTSRLKKALQKNAVVTTPQSRMQKLKVEQLEEARKEAQAIQSEGSEFDIGPFYGLPSKVQHLLEEQRGITTLYDWQKECLSLPALKTGQNLIYSLPTSGGKTLVAEILMLRELLCKKRDALIVLPFVAIVQEKVRGLSNFAVELNFLVEEYAASKGAFPPRKRRKRKSLYVATIEKANSLVNSLIETNRIDELGLVVIDELHMIGEGGSRGATLEMCLTKLLHTAVSTQIIAMSATLSNICDLKKFLKAEVYNNDFRPVELTEHVKISECIYELNPRALCPEDQLRHSRIVTFGYNKEKTASDPDHLAGLALEVIPKHSCLVFCPTKKNCENVAILVCKLMPRDLVEIKQKERRSLIKQLLTDGNGDICPVLKRTILYGVAYHHSGLTTDERKLIEEAYLDGTLCLLCCTSTLAAGVNLPAKRVILRSPYIGTSFLSRSQYKQMVGRAGRAGLDSSGESIVVIQLKDKHKILELVTGPYDTCRSSLLFEDSKGVRAMLLTTIGLQITTTPQSILTFIESTLCHVQASSDASTNMVQLVENALKQLQELGLISNLKSDTGESKLEVTKLGRAVFKGSIDLDRGPQLYGDLCAARESLCVANYLHLLYLVTPYDMVSQVKPQWMNYLNELSCLGSSEINIAASVGVSESFISKKVSGQRVRKPVDEKAIGRFYLSLMLYRLWKQESIWDVSSRFQVPRGFVQQLLTGAAAFASCVAHFCQELEEFWAYQDLLSNFVKRLSYCVTMELIPLVEIPGVKIARARQLFNAGFKTLTLIAHAKPDALVKNIEHMPRKTATQIISAAQMLLNDKADALREEAEEMITLPVSIPEKTDAKVVSESNSQLLDSLFDDIEFDSQSLQLIMDDDSQASIGLT